MMRNRVKTFILDNNKGIVINDKQGWIEYCLEYDENEENIIVRDIEGNILDYFNSGELNESSDINDEKKESIINLKELYKGWLYFEETETIEYNR